MHPKGVETRKQHKKHKPKRKVSELDEIEATRRRDQAARAQRAFRQRKEDTIASLNLRVASLDKTVEDLNSCFLNLTDDLVASNWLQHDSEVAKAVQKSIKRFLFIIRTSQVHQRDNGDIITCQNSTSVTNKPPVLKPPSNASHESSHRNSKTIVADPLSTLSPWREDNQLSDLQNLHCEILQLWTDTTNFMLRLPIPGPMISTIPTFAQRLHMEAIRYCLRLVQAPESYSKQLYQVFNQVLDSYTRERLKSTLSRAFDARGNKLLSAPPKSDVNILCDGALSCTWLNASDVARCFRTTGMEFDGSQSIAIFKDCSSTLTRQLVNGQRFGAPGHSSLQPTHTQF